MTPDELTHEALQGRVAICERTIARLEELAAALEARVKDQAGEIARLEQQLAALQGQQAAD